MQQQQAIGIELDQDVFAAPPESADPRAVEPRGEGRREGTAQVGPPQLGMQDAAPGHPQGKAAPDGLDFGQLRHSAVVRGLLGAALLPS